MRPIEIISLEFLLLSLVAVVVYYVLSPRAQIVWLLGVSYFFYATWSVWYVVVLLVFTTLNYLLAAQIERSPSRGLLISGILVNAGSLVSLKVLTGPYGMHLLEQMGANTLTSILLPIGFSFYVLQAISYLIDVYRRQTEAEKDVIQFALYLAYFPRMLAGPIERAKNFLPQLKGERAVDRSLIEQGIYLILLGLLRKVVISNHLAAILPTEIFSTPQDYTSLERAVWLLVFAFILYNDFAGYTSIVRGVSFLLGIRLSPNFRQPFLARSFSDFWARWHITLSEWLRDYVFFPVRRGLMHAQGSRWLALALPSLVTMLVSGFWHGASLALVLWGFVHGAYLVMEQLLLQSRVLPASGHRAALYRAIVFILVTLAWIPFNTPSVRATGRYLNGFLPPYSTAFENLFLLDLLLLMFFSLWLDWQEQVHGDLAFPRKWSMARQSWGVAVVILLLVLFSSTGIDLSRFVYEFF